MHSFITCFEFILEVWSLVGIDESRRILTTSGDFRLRSSLLFIILLLILLHDTTSVYTASVFSTTYGIPSILGFKQRRLLFNRVHANYRFFLVKFLNIKWSVFDVISAHPQLFEAYLLEYCDPRLFRLFDV